MPLKIRELKVKLRRAGFVQRSAKGSHTRWKHPLLPAVQVTISGHDGDDAKPYQEDDVEDALKALEQLGKGKKRP